MNQGREGENSIYFAGRLGDPEQLAELASV
jgi:hypothetical protein